VRRVKKLAEPIRIRIVSWNVGSLTGKLRELVDAAIRRRVNILCVQETKWKGQKAKSVEDTGFNEEGRRYAMHSLRSFVHDKTPEIMPAINKFFTEPK
jgi:exonuclease III